MDNIITGPHDQVVENALYHYAGYLLRVLKMQGLHDDHFSWCRGEAKQILKEAEKLDIMNGTEFAMLGDHINNQGDQTNETN